MTPERKVVVITATERRQEGADFDVVAVIAGEVVGLIHGVPAAADIVERIVAEAASLLAGGACSHSPRAQARAAVASA
jgi:hypothetical protein